MATKKKPAKKAQPKRMNKSELIRDYAAKNPEAKPAAISEALRKTAAVSPAFVSTVLHAAKSKRKTSKAGKAKGNNAVVPVSSIELAGKLLKECGDKENAIALLKAIG